MTCRASNNCACLTPSAPQTRPTLAEIGRTFRPKAERRPISALAWYESGAPPGKRTGRRRVASARGLHLRQREALHHLHAREWRASRPQTANRLYEKPSEGARREKADAICRARKMAPTQAIREGLITPPKRGPLATTPALHRLFFQPMAAPDGDHSQLDPWGAPTNPRAASSSRTFPSASSAARNRFLMSENISLRAAWKLVSVVYRVSLMRPVASS